jgi:CobQ-like glutamine amidotransferase family enzyme
MIEIYCLYPSALNLNGDAANARVLLQRLRWGKVDAKVLNIESEPELDTLLAKVTAGGKDLILVAGHGSTAAMKSLAKVEGKLRNLFQLAEANGILGVVVGSALTFTSFKAKQSTERRSEFSLASVDKPGWPAQALGYVNSQIAGELVAISGNLILTQLHGPFLAKNPAWTDEVISRLPVSVDASEQAARANLITDEIWKLEAEH